MQNASCKLQEAEAQSPRPARQRAPTTSHWLNGLHQGRILGCHANKAEAPPVNIYRVRHAPEVPWLMMVSGMKDSRSLLKVSTPKKQQGNVGSGEAVTHWITILMFTVTVNCNSEL
jgi:hypothetical protein